MSVRIFTARVTYAGPDALNVTRAANHVLGVSFAPSWDLMRPIIDARRDGEDDAPLWPAYQVGYTDEMRRSYRERRRDWERVLRMREATLCCFCSGPRCHRFLLAEIFRKLGATYEGERPKEAGRGSR